MTRFLAILNPAAGGGKCGRQAGAVLADLRAAGLEIEVAETRAPGDATRLTEQAYAAGFRRFLAVGGDGTSFELVNGLPLGNGEPPPELGFLPLGTGNSFLRDFTADSAAHSIAALKAGSLRPCDAIRLTHREGVLHYINILSLGWVADVNGLRDRRFRGLGQAGYVLSVVTKVAQLRPSRLPLRIEGQPLSELVTFVSINNSRFTGGKMMMAPEADTADGQADLIIVGPMSRLRLLSCFPRIFRGTHIRMPEVACHKVRTIEFDLVREVDVMVDGEARRLVPVRLEVLPAALRIFA
jgi:diacylglycerol kinase (ATP)